LQIIACADQSGVMDGNYPAGGINLGPAMTFGYIACRDLAGLSENEGHELIGRNLIYDKLGRLSLKGCEF
jgi:hypothetical protein